jgi:hypothetical protein
LSSSISPPRAALSLVASLTLSPACSGGPAKEPDGAVASGASVSSAPPVFEVARRIETPAPGGCELQTAPEDEPPRGGLKVFASEADQRDGHALATIEHAAATFRLASGDGQTGAWIEATGHGWTASAFVARKDVPVGLRPSRKILGGLLLPAPGTRPSIVYVDDRAVRIRLTEHELLSPGTLPIEETVACDDLWAGPTPSPTLSSGKRVGLSATEPVGVHDVPSQESEELLHLARRFASRPVLLANEIDRKGGFVRVEVPSSDGWIVGWVDASAVGPPPNDEGAGMVAPPVRLPHAAEDGPRCDRALPFAVTSTMQPVWLGEIRAGSTIRPAKPGTTAPAGWTPIRLEGIAGAFPLVRTDALEACTKGQSGVTPTQ